MAIIFGRPRLHIDYMAGAWQSGRQTGILCVDYCLIALVIGGPVSGDQCALARTHIGGGGGVRTKKQLPLYLYVCHLD